MSEYKNAVTNRLQAECEKLGGQAGWAKAHGFSPAFVNDVLRGRRDITDRLAEALGFQRVTLWKDLRDKDKEPNR